ncbi:MAG: hypothetical protein LBI36_03890, partial [Oscillospiraceae bacterium]|nr:hypothetical protein [Oscillospiraceae bacterium]
SGERTQQVDIYFSFIGNFSFPEAAPPTPEELAAKEKRLKKLANQRAAHQRFYAKKKAAHKRQNQSEPQPEKELRTA